MNRPSEHLPSSLTAAAQQFRQPHDAHDPAADALVDAMARIAEGDRDALHRLYTVAMPRLKPIALHFLRDHHEADDVIHDVFLTVWQKAKQYQPGVAAPLAWLAVITRNRSIDRLRQRARRGTEIAVDEIAEKVVDHGPINLDADSAALQRCLEALGADQRRAIETAFFGGLTYEAIAARHETPLSTIKSRIRRGLKSLRLCLEQ